MDVKKILEEFDWNFYLNYYPDLTESGINNKQDAIVHYLIHGHKENRIYKKEIIDSPNYLLKIREFSELYNITEEQILEDKKIEFRYFCYRYLNFIRNYDIPEIKEKSKYETVIVETREFPHIEFIIRNNIIKLGSIWSHTVICGNKNYEFITNLCEKISKKIKIIKLDVDYLTVNEYSTLLSSENFWNLLTGEKILIYQEDSLIFRKNVYDFLDYDYIGAPWPIDSTISVGNGGLSLRTKKTMLEVINKVKNRDPNLIPPPFDNLINCDILPEDVYFAVAMNQFGIGKLPNKDISQLFSVESVYNPKSFGGHNFWISDENWKKTLYDNAIKQFSCFFETKMIEHRGGWKSVIDSMIKYDFHNEKSDVDFYDLIEKEFLWKNDFFTEKPWFGILHSTPKKVDYVNDKNKMDFIGFLNIDSLFDNNNFLKSLKKCKFIIVLSNYVKDYLIKKLKEYNFDIKVFALKHPVDDKKIIKFNFDNFINNKNKKIVFIGRQLRKLQNFYLLKINNYDKIWLTGSKNFHSMNRMLETEFNYYGLTNTINKNDVEMRYLEDFYEYDEILSNNIVFIDLYDASANNAVLECIIRETPLIIKKLPAIVEYLGEDYPLYFNDINEVNTMITNEKILEAHTYLKNMDKEDLDVDFFIKKIINLTKNHLLLNE